MDNKKIIKKIRTKVIEKIRYNIKKIDKTFNYKKASLDIEEGVYHYSMSKMYKPDEYDKYIPDWTNSRNRDVYIKRATLVINNTDYDGIVNNIFLVKDLIDGLVKPYDIGFSMTPEEMFPQRYIKYVEKFLEEEEVPDGDFRCGKCKSRKIVYFTQQCRSADEMTSQFFTCTRCKNRWRIG